MLLAGGRKSEVVIIRSLWLPEKQLSQKPPLNGILKILYVPGTYFDREKMEESVVIDRF